MLNGGFVFSGTYNKGKWEGIGRAYAPTGIIYYNGNFKQWQWHGQGTMKDRKTSDVWSGIWFENLMQEGVLTKANGEKYKQSFNP